MYVIESCAKQYGVTVDVHRSKLAFARSDGRTDHPRGRRRGVQVWPPFSMHKE